MSDVGEQVGRVATEGLNLAIYDEAYERKNQSVKARKNNVSDEWTASVQLSNFIVDRVRDEYIQTLGSNPMAARREASLLRRGRMLMKRIRRYLLGKTKYYSTSERIAFSRIASIFAFVQDQGGTSTGEEKVSHISMASK